MSKRSKPALIEALNTPHPWSSVAANRRRGDPNGVASRARLAPCYPLTALLDERGLANLRPYLRETFTETYAALMKPEIVTSAEGSGWWPAYATLHRLIGPEASATLHTSYDVGRAIEKALYAKARALGAPPVMRAVRR